MKQRLKTVQTWQDLLVLSTVSLFPQGLQKLSVRNIYENPSVSRKGLNITKKSITITPIT